MLSASKPSCFIFFQKMAVIVVGTGCLFSFIFHLGTKEPPAEVQNEKGQCNSQKRL